MTSLPQNFVQVAEFAIDANDGFLPGYAAAPLILNPSPARVNNLIDDQTIARDYLNLHFGNKFHDPTIMALEHSVGAASLRDRLKEYKIVTDRRSLRKLIMNECIDLPPNPYYCKKANVDLVAEKINGTLYLAGLVHYQETPGGYGKSFETAMTNHTDGRDVKTYRMSKFSLKDMPVLVRYEVDARESTTGRTAELKCKKEPNPRYGFSADFYLNIWIQMVISNTHVVRIGLQKDGRLSKITDYSLSEMQQHASLSNAQVERCFAKLTNLLSQCYDRIADGKKVIIRMSGTVGVNVRIANSSDVTTSFRMFSAGILTKLTTSSTSSKSSSTVVTTEHDEEDDEEETEELDTVFQRMAVTTTRPLVISSSAPVAKSRTHTNTNTQRPAPKKPSASD